MSLSVWPDRGKCNLSVWLANLPKAELPAHHLGVSVVPLVITNSAPPSCMKHLHSTFKVFLASDQPQRRATACNGDDWMTFSRFPVSLSVKLNLSAIIMCVRGNIQVHHALEVTLTFWWCTHHCCLVSMATITSDKRPAPALTQGVLITAATQSLVVEEAGAWAELWVLQRRANVAVGNKHSGI